MRQIHRQPVRRNAAGQWPMGVGLVGAQVHAHDFVLVLAIHEEFAFFVRDAEFERSAAVYFAYDLVGLGIDHHHLAGITGDHQHMAALAVIDDAVGIGLGLDLAQHFQCLEVEHDRDTGLAVIGIAFAQFVHRREAVGDAAHIDGAGQGAGLAIDHRHLVAMRNVNPRRTGIEHHIVPAVGRADRHALAHRVTRRWLCLRHQDCRSAACHDQKLQTYLHHALPVRPAKI